MQGPRPRAIRRQQAPPKPKQASGHRLEDERRRRATLLIPAALTAGAIVVALGMLALDRLIGEEALPSWLHFGPDGARSLLVTLVGAFLTVVALVFWVRMMAVQLASDEFSSRLLRPFLDDRVHQEAMGAIVAGLAYCLVVLRAVPDGSAGMTHVPHLSVLLAAVFALAAAGLIVVAVYSGAERTRIGWIVRWLATQTVRGIQRRHPPLGAQGGEGWLELDPPEPPDAPSRLVRARDSGWVRRIDENALLRALPADGVIQLDVRAGVFIVEGRPLARVWDGDPDSSRSDTDAVDRAICEAIPVGIDPSVEEDVSHGIRQLCDIADRAATGGGDSTTVHEVTVHVGLVLKELLLRDLPAPTLADDEGRTVLRPRELGLRQYVDLAMVRLRSAARESTGISELLLDTIGMLAEALEESGLHSRAEYLREHASVVLTDVEQQGEFLDIDKRRAYQRAVSSGALPGDGDRPEGG